MAKINSLSKKELLEITKKIETDKGMTGKEIDRLLDFRFKEPKRDIWKIVSRTSFALSLLVGGFIIMFPDVVAKIIERLPSFFYLNDRVAAGLDYIWGIIGEPTGQTHLFYHLPNIILYSFGVVGLRNLVAAISRRGWKDRVAAAKEKLKKEVEEGTLEIESQDGFSILFIGAGDYVGESLERNKDIDTVLLASCKQNYTNTWNDFHFKNGFEQLEQTLRNISAGKAGEYLFFPVKDNQLFLPGPLDFDIAPHRLDILIRSIREVEQKNKWHSKRIIVVGDRFQKSSFQTEDEDQPLISSRDEITFQQLCDKHDDVSLIDPTDLVLQEILQIAQGKNILFRSSDKGILKYKAEFYRRLKLLGYEPAPQNRDLTIGYDIYEHQTEQQSLEYKNRNYLPVVMSQDVYEGLIRSGYEKQNILYIPDIVLGKLRQEALKQ